MLIQYARGRHGIPFGAATPGLITCFASFALHCHCTKVSFPVFVFLSIQKVCAPVRDGPFGSPEKRDKSSRSNCCFLYFLSRGFMYGHIQSPLTDLIHWIGDLKEGVPVSTAFDIMNEDGEEEGGGFRGSLVEQSGLTAEMYEFVDFFGNEGMAISGVWD